MGDSRESESGDSEQKRRTGVSEKITEVGLSVEGVNV